MTEDTLATDGAQLSQDVPSMEGHTIVAVHAHPDDEAVWTGLLLAQAARRGATVVVITCTMGEEGEVIGEKYQGLCADSSDMLGGYRIHELRAALAELGVEPHPRFLGGAGRWRDSGMVGSPAQRHERAFSHPTDEVRFRAQVEDLSKALAEVQPDVVVTYGPDGGYGHPDHIRAHHITHAAVESGLVQGVKQILWHFTEQEELDRGLEALEVPHGWLAPRAGDIAAVPTEQIDFRLRGASADVEAKRRAMRAHATQVWMADGSQSDANPHPRTVAEGAPMAWCFSNRIAQPLLGTESYAVGYTAPGCPADYARQLFGVAAESTGRLSAEARERS